MTGIAVVVPRLDMSDGWRNKVQAFCGSRLEDVPQVVGRYEPDGRPWSMSRAVNAGRASTGADHLLIAPADYIISAGMARAVSAALEDRPWVSVFRRVVQLGEAATRDALAGRPIGAAAIEWVTDRCMPCVGVRVDVFDDVGGWDERFVGRAPEDTAFRWKLHVLHGPAPAPLFDAVVELWCPSDRSADDGLLDHPLYRRYLAARTPGALRALIDEEE